MRFLLVHSPAVGPCTWRWVADALRHAGHEAIVPDLTGAAVRGDPLEFVDAAARAGPASLDRTDECAIVGHSGAGPMLPGIAARVASLSGAARSSVVFVDAGMPPCAGAFTAGGAFVETLRELAVDGVLPVWSQWWGKGVLEALVPDEDRRTEVAAELPGVPLSFYETPLIAPADWCRARCAYVLLSEPYRSDAGRARTLDWPVVEVAGGHLDIVRRPVETATALLEVTARAGS